MPSKRLVAVTYLSWAVAVTTRLPRSSHRTGEDSSGHGLC